MITLPRAGTDVGEAILATKVKTMWARETLQLRRPQLEAAQAALRRERIVCNQVLYHLGDRGVETAVLPDCERAGIAVVGYTPLARGGFLRGVVAQIAREARAHAHVRENAAPSISR